MPSSPSPPTAKKLIAVFGATGTQGSSVLHSLAHNPTTFALRALTRHPDSPRAAALTAAAAPGSTPLEIVRCDGWCRADLLAALRGSWGVFVNTNTEDESCNPPSPHTESDLGALILSAAAEAHVPHVIYSSLSDVDALTDASVPCRMMRHKACVWTRALQMQAVGAFVSVTAVEPGWFFEGLLDRRTAGLVGGFPWRVDGEGWLSCRVPRWGGDASWTGVRADFGDVVHGVFLEPERWNRRVVQGISEMIDWDGVVDAWNRVFPGPEWRARFVEMRCWEDLETHGDPGLEDVKELYHFAEVVGRKPQGAAEGGEEWRVETETALRLKRSAWVAMGRHAEEVESVRLMTAERFIRENFAAERGEGGGGEGGK